MFTWITKALAEETGATGAEPTWFQTAFEKLGEFPIWGWVMVAVLLLGGLALWRAARGSKKTVWNAQAMAMAAMCIALSCVLGCIRLWRMPQGGSVTAASMLPLMLFSYLYGVGPGMLVGAVYGVLDFLLGGANNFLSPMQWLLDYPVTYLMVGLAGLFRAMKNEQLGLSLGVVLACVGRWMAAVAAGVFFWAEYAPEGMSPLVYSLGYNGSYMSIECLLCVVIALLVGVRLSHEMKKAL